jgi:hypothetical protein
MRKHINHIAGAIFLLSFLLPAYRPDREAYSGWECLQFCFGTLSGDSAKGGWRFYYFGFVITNLLFLFTWIFPALKDGFRLKCAWLSLIPLAHVISWLVLNFLDQERQGRLLVDYGYYTWLSAFALLSASLFITKNEKNK